MFDPNHGVTRNRLLGGLTPSTSSTHTQLITNADKWWIAFLIALLVFVIFALPLLSYFNLAMSWWTPTFGFGKRGGSAIFWSHLVLAVLVLLSVRALLE
jgi:hypothetical protein